MFLLLPITVALAADPTPGPSSAARPTPLTEIGRVRALPACVPIVAHANGAITQALDNDRTLAITSTNLHNTDFDTDPHPRILSTNLPNTDFDKLNFLQRRNAIEALMKQAEIMRINSSAGD